MIIKRKKSNIHHCVITFFPGNNLVPVDKVEEVKNNPNLKELIENGVHEVVLESKIEVKDGKKKAKKTY